MKALASSTRDAAYQNLKAAGGTNFMNEETQSIPTDSESGKHYLRKKSQRNARLFTISTLTCLLVKYQ